MPPDAPDGVAGRSLAVLTVASVPVDKPLPICESDLNNFVILRYQTAILQRARSRKSQAISRGVCRRGAELRFKDRSDPAPWGLR
jgi:hypothetical protein